MNFSTTEIEPSFLASTLHMHQCYGTLSVRVGKSSTLRKLTAKPGATHTTVVSRITNHTLSSDRQLRDVPEDTQMKMNSIIMHQCCFYFTHATEPNLPTNGNLLGKMPNMPSLCIANKMAKYIVKLPHMKR